MKQQSRSFTNLEVADLFDSSRFSLELSCPACGGPVDYAEIEPHKSSPTSSGKRFSYVCTVCSSHGEYETDAFARPERRELVSS